MATFVDDEIVDLQAPSLGALIKQAQRQLSTGRRIIVEVRIDGEAVEGDSLSRRQEEAIDGRDVHFVTAEPAQLAAEALTQVRGLLEGAGTGLEQAADLLQRDDFPEAMKLIAQAVDAWQKAPPAIVQAAELVGLDSDDLTVDGRTFATLTDDLVGQLRALRDLLQNRDTLGLADMLAYEMPRTTSHWTAMIEQVLDRLEDA